MPKNWIVIGVSGATCSGKTTIANQLREFFPNAEIIHQDAFFLLEDDERMLDIPELRHWNFEVMESLDMEGFRREIHTVLNTDPKENATKDTFLEKIATLNDAKLLEKARQLDNIDAVLILDGFLILNDSEVRNLCDVSFYFTLDKKTCWDRRSVRTYEPADVPGYFDGYVWPFYEKHFAELKMAAASDITYLDGRDNIAENMVIVLNKALDFLLLKRG